MLCVIAFALGRSWENFPRILTSETNCSMSSSKQAQCKVKIRFLVTLLVEFWWLRGGDYTTWSERPVVVLGHFIKPFSFYLAQKKRGFNLLSQLCIFKRRCVSHVLEN